MSDALPFLLRGEFITLDALLKASGLCGSGGEAKQLIAAGSVQVDGEIELRRGRKLRAGQRVQALETCLYLAAASPPAPTPSDHA
ncbi:MAG: RNA-binding S4 domain-containing protein [Burkholderiaceae bacterium]|nr:RNA-binding S4 domain-containing protein [Burkholderiaceae bacterium]